MSDPEVVVVGAGLSGLAAGRHLLRAGVTAQVIEKSRGLGGRLATRRVDGQTVDHGCPALELTAGMPLADEVSALGPKEAVTIGGTGLSGLRSGMTRLAKSIGADLDVLRDTRVGALAPRPTGVAVLDDHGAILAEPRTVIVSAPGPQAAELLRTGGDSRAEALGAVHYEPALVVLAEFAGPAPASPVLVTSGLVRRIVDEGAKRPTASAEGAVVAGHLSAAASRELLDANDEEEVARALPALASALGLVTSRAGGSSSGGATPPPRRPAHCASPVLGAPASFSAAMPSRAPASTRPSSPGSAPPTRRSQSALASLNS